MKVNIKFSTIEKFVCKGIGIALLIIYLLIQAIIVANHFVVHYEAEGLWIYVILISCLSIFYLQVIIVYKYFKAS